MGWGHLVPREWCQGKGKANMTIDTVRYLIRVRHGGNSGLYKVCVIGNID